MPAILKKRIFNQHGITLIELIAVILIIGIIAAVGIPVVFGQIQKAEDKADAANIALVNDAVERYATIKGHYVPIGSINTVAGLIEFLQQVPAIDGGPYLSAGVNITFNTAPELVTIPAGTATHITGIK